MEKELFAKIQYHNFEPGEFVYNQKVDFENALSAIRSFPWEEERRTFHVDLTSPSITFQTDDNLFLKLSLYYNGKFILYYYNGKHLYTHSFTSLEVSFAFIEYFFINQDIDRSKYKLEPNWRKNLRLHFFSQDFVYSTANKSFFQSMGYWTRGLLIFDIVAAGFLLYEPNTTRVVLLLIWVVLFGGINFLIHRNYYRHSKNETLVLSKGSDSFLFGKSEAPTKYFKKDIQQIIIERNNARRCPWNGYTVTYLEMKNGEVLKISSILLDGYEIEKKIPDTVHKIRAVMAPFIS